jgi:hypothetical protein
VAGKNDDGGQGKEVDRHVWAANHASAFAFELLAKLEVATSVNNEVKNQYNVAGDYVLGDKVMGDKVGGDKINGDRSVYVNSDVQDAVIITGDHNQVVVGSNVKAGNQSGSGSRRSFYESQLARKQNDLAAVEMNLDTVQGQLQEQRLRKHAEQLLVEIEKLEQMLTRDFS